MFTKLFIDGVLKMTENEETLFFGLLSIDLFNGTLTPKIVHNSFSS